MLSTKVLARTASSHVVRNAGIRRMAGIFDSIKKGFSENEEMKKLRDELNATSSEKPEKTSGGTDEKKSTPPPPSAFSKVASFKTTMSDFKTKMEESVVETHKNMSAKVEEQDKAQAEAGPSSADLLKEKLVSKVSTAASTVIDSKAAAAAAAVASAAVNATAESKTTSAFSKFVKNTAAVLEGDSANKLRKSARAVDQQVKAIGSGASKDNALPGEGHQTSDGRVLYVRPHDVDPAIPVYMDLDSLFTYEDKEGAPMMIGPGGKPQVVSKEQVEELGKGGVAGMLVVAEEPSELSKKSAELQAEINKSPIAVKAREIQTSIQTSAHPVAIGTRAVTGLFSKVYGATFGESPTGAALRIAEKRDPRFDTGKFLQHVEQHALPTIFGAFFAGDSKTLERLCDKAVSNILTHELNSAAKSGFESKAVFKETRDIELVEAQLVGSREPLVVLSFTCMATDHVVDKKTGDTVSGSPTNVKNYDYTMAFQQRSEDLTWKVVDVALDSISDTW